jgi:hypothetical protein
VKLPPRFPDIVVGTEAPEIWPVCAHPQSFFEINLANY